MTLSLLITRVATVALTLTGLSKEVARFQARSAFSGAGFTTAEAEAVTNHPVRRRIILLLMLLGSAGVASIIATLLLSFTSVSDTDDGLIRLLLMLGGLLVLTLIARSRLVDRYLSWIIERALRRITGLDTRDYASLLRLTGDWLVVELEVEEDDWIAERALSELDLAHEGVLVLGIERADGRYVGAPTGSTCMQPGDTVLLYGRESVLADLDMRRRAEGAAAHEARLREYRRALEEQQREEQEAQSG